MFYDLRFFQPTIFHDMLIGNDWIVSELKKYCNTLTKIEILFISLINIYAL